MEICLKEKCENVKCKLVADILYGNFKYDTKSLFRVSHINSSHIPIPCPSAGVYKILGIAEYISYSFRFGLMHFSHIHIIFPFFAQTYY